MLYFKIFKCVLSLKNYKNIYALRKLINDDKVLRYMQKFAIVH